MTPSEDSILDMSHLLQKRDRDSFALSRYHDGMVQLLDRATISEVARMTKAPDVEWGEKFAKVTPRPTLERFRRAMMAAVTLEVP